MLQIGIIFCLVSSFYAAFCLARVTQLYDRKTIAFWLKPSLTADYFATDLKRNAILLSFWKIHDLLRGKFHDY